MPRSASMEIKKKAKMLSHRRKERSACGCNIILQDRIRERATRAAPFFFFLLLFYRKSRCRENTFSGSVSSHLCPVEGERDGEREGGEGGGRWMKMERGRHSRCVCACASVCANLCAIERMEVVRFVSLCSSTRTHFTELVPETVAMQLPAFAVRKCFSCGQK